MLKISQEVLHKQTMRLIANGENTYKISSCKELNNTF